MNPRQYRMRIKSPRYVSLGRIIAFLTPIRELLAETGVVVRRGGYSLGPQAEGGCRSRHLAIRTLGAELVVVKDAAD